jgi:hypothetical protein
MVAEGLQPKKTTASEARRGGRNDRLADTAPNSEADHGNFNRRSLTGIIPTRSIPDRLREISRGRKPRGENFCEHTCPCPASAGCDRHSGQQSKPGNAPGFFFVSFRTRNFVCDGVRISEPCASTSSRLLDLRDHWHMRGFLLHLGYGGL